MKKHLFELLDELPEPAKLAIDGLSIATLIGSLVQVLPHIAAILTIVWTGIRIWETRTVQGWLGRVSSRDRDRDGEH